MQTQVGQFIWHDLLTTDVGRAQSFYTELLGWEIETWKPGEVDYPMIATKGVQHGGFGLVEDGGSSHWVGNVVVEDVEAAVAGAQQEGGTIRGEPGGHPEVGSWATIVDPQGGVVSAFKPGYDSPTPAGVFVWEELFTPDPDAAKAFYGSVFGWTFESRDMGDSGTYTMFKKADGESVAGMLRKPDDVPGPAEWYPYLASEDVDASVATASKLGARTFHGPVEIESVGRYAVLADPTGATFGLHEGA